MAATNDAQPRGPGAQPPGEKFSFAHWSSLRPLPATVRPAGIERRGGPGLLERLTAVVLLLIASPVLLLIALVITLDSPGAPVLYRQARTGLNRRGMDPGRMDVPSERRTSPGAGQVFQIYKFRTMIPNAEKVSGPVWASANDPRITRVGRVLRHLRLDELPQVLNVIKGEMRLIGPRPERPHFVSQLSAEIPDYTGRLNVPPGITGLAQVEKEYDESIDDVRRKVKYDLFYVKNRCTLLDIKILLRTIDVMVRGRGAR